MSERTFTNAAFRAFLAEHRLMGARCSDCGATFLPPRPMCTSCFGSAMEWVEFGGEGTLAAFTAVYIGPTAMINAGYDRTHPYVSGVVTLVEGPAISAQILGMDAAHPEQINIGAPLRAAFIERGEGEQQATFLAFEPA